MHTPKTNQPTKTKKKTGNFNRGKCLGLPLTGFDMLVKINSIFTNGQAANEKTCQTLLNWLTGNWKLNLQYKFYVTEVEFL